MALPKHYLADQPDLEDHVQNFYIRVDILQKDVIDLIRIYMDGSLYANKTLAPVLEAFQAKWIGALKRLKHSKDELNDKHFYRPLLVRTADLLLPSL